MVSWTCRKAWLNWSSSWSKITLACWDSRDRSLIFPKAWSKHQTWDWHSTREKKKVVRQTSHSISSSSLLAADVWRRFFAPSVVWCCDCCCQRLTPKSRKLLRSSISSSIARSSIGNIRLRTSMCERLSWAMSQRSCCMANTVGSQFSLNSLKHVSPIDSQSSGAKYTLSDTVYPTIDGIEHFIPNKKVQ